MKIIYTVFIGLWCYVREKRIKDSPGFWKRALRSNLLILLPYALCFMPYALVFFLKKDIILFMPLVLVFCSCFCLMLSVLEPATFCFLVTGAPMVRARISSFEDVCSSHLFFGLLGSGSPLAIAFCFKASTSSLRGRIRLEKIKNNKHILRDSP